MASNAPPPNPSPLSIIQATESSIPAVLHLFDTAVEWLVSQNRTGQWGTAPFSTNPQRPDQLREFITTGHGLWLVVKPFPPTTTDTGNDAINPVTIHTSPPGIIVGALAVGDKMPYVPAVDEPEVYVRMLIAARTYVGDGIGKRLLEHARGIARKAGVSLMRVDCYGGDDEKLVKYYESQGFRRVLRLEPKENWPCQVLEMRVEGEEGC
ncbi:hypothetical protein FQN50_005359 [Emmonsiellopsis sp. PD_5]|nr:hypothetical protein FQN50_005359 [Emmonsiellopsis sp. PD_5]